jgi:hypothetical protein
VSTQGFPVNPLILGSRTFEVNPRSGKLFCICERCRQKQAEFKERTKEHKKRVDAEYHAKEENKAKKRARERSEKYRAKKKIQNANYKARPEVQKRIKDYKQRPEVQKRIREYNNRPEVKEQRNTRQRHEYHTDILKRCRQNLSHSLSKKITAHLQGKTLREKNTLEVLGCSMDTFVKHIEDQFEYGMSWDNYGRKPNVRCWHLDHIIPAFYKENEISIVLERSHYTNFSKSNRYIGKHTRNLLP